MGVLCRYSAGIPGHVGWGWWEDPPVSEDEPSAGSSLSLEEEFRAARSCLAVWVPFQKSHWREGGACELKRFWEGRSGGRADGCLHWRPLASVLPRVLRGSGQGSDTCHVVMVGPACAQSSAVDLGAKGRSGLGWRLRVLQFLPHCS